MQNTAHYIEKPQPWLVERLASGMLRVTINANPVQEEKENGDGPPSWAATEEVLVVEPGELDLDAVAEDPAAYLDYATNASKREAKRRIAEWKKGRTEAGLHVDTTLGWPVEYSYDAVLDCMGIFLMLLGQQPVTTDSWVDAYEQEHTGLTQQDVVKIALAVALFRINIQKAVNAARKAVDAARTNAQVQEALASLYSTADFNKQQQ